jgi:uncharacterized NAD-dependent epimerase/dehydratase family protein
MIPKPYLLFIGEAKDELAIKTAAGIYEWRPNWCKGQYVYKEAKVHLNLPSYNFTEAAEHGIKTMVIGIVNAGGVLSERWKQTIVEAIDSGLNIASGMHVRLSSIPEINKAAIKNNIDLFDLRFNDKTFPTGKGTKRSGKRLLTVGTDCSVGKKYTALAIEKAMQAEGIDAEFKATGQTGVLIAEKGIAVDAIISDFISGAVEWLTPDNKNDHWDIIEGQGSLFHPSFAGVSLGLLHGSQPDAFILCHEPTRTKMRGVETLLPSLDLCIEENIRLGRLTNPNIHCAGIALNTSVMSTDPKKLKDEISAKYNLPCVDPLKDDLAEIISTLKNIK